MSVATQMLLNQVALFTPHPKPLWNGPVHSDGSPAPIKTVTSMLPIGIYVFGWTDPRKVLN